MVKQAMLDISSMQPDAVQAVNKPLEARSNSLTGSKRNFAYFMGYSPVSGLWVCQFHVVIKSKKAEN
jgi:hypothetical protein